MVHAVIVAIVVVIVRVLVIAIAQNGEGGCMTRSWTPGDIHSEHKMHAST
jgi:hypothetical protein